MKREGLGGCCRVGRAHGEIHADLAVSRARARDRVMLIGIPPLLGPDFLHALRAMGHGDEIALVDGNYPAAEHARRLVRADGHGVLAVLRAVLAVLPLDRDVPSAIFRASQGNDPALTGPIHAGIDATCAELAPGLSVTALSGDALYARIRAAFAVVATSEPALYANVILRKGVISAGIGGA